MQGSLAAAILKVWIDHIVRARRTFNITKVGKVGTLQDRPVFVAIASGGRFSGDRAQQPDFLTPYLKAILALIGLHDLTFFSVQGTGSGLGCCRRDEGQDGSSAASVFFLVPTSFSWW